VIASVIVRGKKFICTCFKSQMVTEIELYETAGLTQLGFSLWV